VPIVNVNPYTKLARGDVLPGLKLYSMSVDANTTFGHVIRIQADMKRAVSRDEVLEVFKKSRSSIYLREGFLNSRLKIFC
jgi:glyceraldehyde-3-phosphate dehydrogenase/erythrose-4-phosphate dehydrogenase